ncbi:MAG TPA: carboxypeptidase-like regulatory domain-containing protein, partial [Pyrinomonadaceae bacterium]
GVAVTVRNAETGQTRAAASDGEGRWTMPALPVGTYEVTYELAGFRRQVRPDVRVEAAVPRTLEDRLEVGSLEGESVMVTDQATLVTPETSTAFRQVDSESLVAVPTSTRSFTHLLSTEAGVSSDLPPVLTNGNGNISPSVNGTRTTSTSLFFNGVDATNITTNEGSLNDNIAPAPETLQEVKLQTSLYDASTGRSGGGNFQLITRQGGNTFNGSVYYYVQNSGSTPTTSSSTRKGSTARRPAATRAASPSAAPSSVTSGSSSAATRRPPPSPASSRRRAQRPSCPSRCAASPASARPRTWPPPSTPRTAARARTA